MRIIVSNDDRLKLQQESITVGCVQPAYQPYVFGGHQVSVLVVGPVQWGPMNKFEQVSMAGTRGWSSCPCLEEGLEPGQGDPVSWVMVTWGPLPLSHCGQTDTHEWKHYLPATSLAGIKNLAYTWRIPKVKIFKNLSLFLHHCIFTMHRPRVHSISQ